MYRGISRLGEQFGARPAFFWGLNVTNLNPNVNPYVSINRHDMDAELANAMQLASTFRVILG